MTETQPKIDFGAAFSPCRRYRYALWRTWGAYPLVTFIGLNPSVADETVDDPTIRRCVQFARDWGYHGMRMLNLFAFRATYPDDMKAMGAHAIGPDNDQTILRYLSDPANKLTVAAWGKHGNHLSRGWEVARKLLDGFTLQCLGKNADGTPKHPLYVRADKKLEAI